GAVGAVAVPGPRLLLGLRAGPDAEMAEQTAERGDELITGQVSQRAGGDLVHLGVEMHGLRFQQVEHGALAGLELLAVGDGEAAAGLDLAGEQADALVVGAHVRPGAPHGLVDVPADAVEAALDLAQALGALAAAGLVDVAVEYVP